MLPTIKELLERDAGRGVVFTIDDGDTTYRYTLSGDMLDTELGPAADITARRAWVKDNLAEIVKMRPEGGLARPPFNQVMVEEIS